MDNDNKNQPNVLVSLNPKTAPRAASKKVKDFQASVDEAGYFELDPEETQELKALNLLPPDFQGPELPTAINLYSKGTDGEKLSDTATRLAFLSEGERQFLQRTAFIIESFKRANIREFPSFEESYAANQEPEIVISEVPREHTPAPNQLTLTRSEGILKPLLKEGVGRVAEIAKQKLKNFAVKAIKKGAKILVKEGAKLAVRAGIVGAKAAVSATGVGAIAVAVFEAGKLVYDKLLKPIFRKIGGVIRGFLQAITGEKDTRKALFWGGLAAGAIFLGLGILPLAILSGIISLGAGALLLGGTAIAAGIAGIPAVLWAAVTTTVLTIGASTIIAVLFIPVAVVLILFIINSGAYVVPHSPLLLFSQQQFIDVEKVGEPDGPFDNGDLPITITYTITVNATQDALTNISFEHDCKVLRENNPPSCPDPLPADTPTVISPTTPFTFSYTATYGSSFTDSAVIDTFTVNADTPEQTGVSASGTETIIIGDPPLGCFIFQPDDAPYIAEFQAAAAELVSHSTYAAKLCDAGDISVQLNTSGPISTGACAGAGPNSMFFNNCLYFQTHGQAFITYLFAHESGHTYEKRNPNDFTAFQKQNVMSEGGLPTYCIKQPPPPNEDFADTIGDYVDNGSLRRLCRDDDQRPFNICGGGWPLHCNFARNVIFEE